MKQIIGLYQTLQQNSFEKRYPDFSMNDDKVHVLFIGTYLNGNGYYRHIIPAFELNQTDTHVAIISSLIKWDYNLQFGDSDENPIDHQLVRWADYVVLPVILSDAQYFFSALREHNSNIQIVIDLDQNFHNIPEQHPAFGSIGLNEKEHLLRNIAHADILNLASQGLLYCYEQLLQEEHPDSLVHLNHQPNLLSPIAYEGSPPLHENENEKTRIGLIGGLNSVMDFQVILPALKQISETFKDRIEFIFFGWNGETKDKDILNGLKITFERSVRFTQFFNKLNTLSLDIALLPLADHPYNTHGRSAMKYLELSAMAIPVIATDLPPYNLAIKEDKSGLLAEDDEEWVSQITKLINDRNLRREIGDNALKAAWYNYGCNWESQESLNRLFR